MKIDKDNFYKYTCCVWKEVELLDLCRDIDKKPHVYYESESGSKYYALKDKVYRISNHFNYDVNTCSWLVLRTNEVEPTMYNELASIVTVAEYKDFSPKRTMWVDYNTPPENYPKLLKSHGVYPDSWESKNPRPPVVRVPELLDSRFGITYHILPPKYLALFNKEVMLQNKRIEMLETLKKNKVSFSYFIRTKTGKRRLGHTYYDLKFTGETDTTMKFKKSPRGSNENSSFVYLEKSKLYDIEIIDSK